MRRKLYVKCIYAIVLAGLLSQGILLAMPYGVYLYYKASGKGGPCPMPAVLMKPLRDERLGALQAETLKSLQPSDGGLDGCVLVMSPRRAFYVGAGNGNQARDLLARAIARQRWLAQDSNVSTVRAGDVVISMGGDFGVFADLALEQGAGRVILIEPDSLRAQCLTQSFLAEIAAGAIVLAQTSAGSSKPLPLDEVIAGLKLPRVDFIRLLGEAAHPRVLDGASNIMSLWKPRMMLDSFEEYSRSEVLTSLARKANSRYQAACGPCDLSADKKALVPSAMFFR